VTEVGAAIVEAIGRGVPLLEAVKVAGISHTTFCRWRKQSAEYADAVCAAERAARVVRGRRRIQVDVDDLPRAAALLRRRLSEAQIAELRALLS
jgi:hypothetical protein